MEVFRDPMPLLVFPTDRTRKSGVDQESSLMNLNGSVLYSAISSLAVGRTKVARLLHQQKLRAIL
jgi:hypothetical protein